MESASPPEDQLCFWNFSAGNPFNSLGSPFPPAAPTQVQPSKGWGQVTSKIPIKSYQLSTVHPAGRGWTGSGGELRDPCPHRRFGSWKWSLTGWRQRVQKGESTWWKKCRMGVMQRSWKLYLRSSLWAQRAAGSSKLIRDLCIAYSIKCYVHRESRQTNWQDMSIESRLEKVSWEINFQIFNLPYFIYFYLQ